MRPLLSIVLAVGFLGLQPVPAVPAPPSAAPPPDPAALIDAIRRDGDLQVRLPAVAEAVPPIVSPFTLRIPGAGAILWSAAIGGAICLIVAGVRGHRRWRSRSGRPATPVGEAVGAAIVLDRMTRRADEADDLARLGRYAEAMHALLLQGLDELRGRLGMALADSLTSREILRRVDLAPDGKAGFGDLIGRVEIVHFGQRSADRGDYAACRASYERLLAAMIPSGAAPVGGIAGSA